MQQSEQSVSVILSNESKKDEKASLDLSSTITELVVDNSGEKNIRWCRRVWMGTVASEKEVLVIGVECNKKAVAARNTTEDVIHLDDSKKEEKDSLALSSAMAELC